VAEVRGEFMNPEEGECLQMKYVTRGLVKRKQTEKTQYVLWRNYRV
jgi:hypothetical protein